MKCPALETTQGSSVNDDGGGCMQPEEGKKTNVCSLSDHHLRLNTRPINKRLLIDQHSHSTDRLGAAEEWGVATHSL